MSEVRKVIGVFDELLAARGAIEFPSVRVWIRGPNDFVMRDLKQAFPTRGTVFLHISSCENQHPRLHQIGLFNCIRSKPGESAEWEVDTTSQRLANVVDYSSQVEGQQWSFWRWLHNHEEKRPCSILLGDGTAYVRRGKDEVIGPFSLSEQGKLVPEESTFVFQDVEVANVDVAGRRCRVIDVDLLPQGEPLILDPREAILRRLKLIHRSRRFAWLSRDKVQELAAALALVEKADGSEWVMGDLPTALSLLCESTGIEPKLIEALLEIDAVEEAVEAAWETKRAEAIKKSKAEIEREQTRLAEFKSRAAGVEAELAASQAQKTALEATLADLEKKAEAGKSEAQRVFDAELKRLARSPASMAMLGAWSSAGDRGDHTQLSVRMQHSSGKEEHVSSLAEALLGNFRSCGLSPGPASELSTVCQAALVAGQLICFRCVFSEILAEAVASALGKSAILSADVPAGLLDPVDWNSLLDDDQKGYPIILQGANRSDISLVLGSIRVRLFREALGFERPSAVVLITLESRAGMEVETDVPFGPIIDDRVLKFHGAKGSVRICSCAEYVQQQPEIEPLTAEEFATSVGDEVMRLPLFSISSHEVAYRRSYSALRAVIPNADNAPRIFFKYWCFPRASSVASQSVLDAHKEDWRHDQTLIKQMEVATRDD